MITLLCRNLDNEEFDILEDGIYNKVRKFNFMKEVVLVLVYFKQKSQITIPKGLVKKLNLKVGDKFDAQVEDGKLVLTPVITIPKEQGWYYSSGWQEKEKKVDQQIKEGKLRVTQSTEELFKDLGLDKS